MRIAFLRLSAAPLVRGDTEQNIGGAEVRALTFAKGLSDRSNHVVRLLVGGEAQDPYARGRLLIHPVQSERQESDRRSLPSRLTRSLKRRLGREPAAWKAIADLPVEFIACFGLQDPTASAIWTAKQTGKRAVVFLTSDHDTYRALAPASIVHRHRRWHRFAILNADLVVAQTHYQCQLVEQASTSSVALIRNPIDTATVADELVPITHRKYVLWIGRADTNCKRADLCWQVARKCPDIPFLAILNPLDRRTTELLVREAPPNVSIRDRVDWSDSDLLFQGALALLNTSDSEGFPNTFLQAAKFGVPILSRRVNPDGVLTRFRIGFVASDDLSQLAKMIEQLHANPQQFEYVSAQGPRYVREYHASDGRVAELEAALTQLATRPERLNAA